MRLIDADALLSGNDSDVISVEAIKNAPTVDAVILPCKPGDDYWWIHDNETLDIECDKGGIKAVIVYEDHFGMIDVDRECLNLHTEWSCLSREEAEKLREKLLVRLNKKAP